MIRLVAYLLAVLVVAISLAWLADRPGNLVIRWQGWDIETTVFRAVVLLAIVIGFLTFLGAIVRHVWTSPATVGRYLNQRRQERGLDALSGGLIALGAGDRVLATRYALQARKTLPNEPLTHLLRAQAAQLAGDRSTSRRIFEAMLSSPDTEQLGLRGLYLEAEREGEREAAHQFAERAVRLNPKLGWAVDALFEMQCRNRDWSGALETLAAARKQGQIEKAVADRRRAVLLTAQAQELEDANSQKALDLAQEAHALAPDLVPAAVITGRQLASRGSTPKAARVIERAWKSQPHPDLALVYAYARPGDSPRDRLERLKRLARTTPHSVEGPIAAATTAIEARQWEEARRALEPLLTDRLSQRVCTLMARLEGGEHENAGGVREWLARAVNAPRDPVWTADGVVSERWEAVSPVTGALDAFQWRVPLEAAGDDDAGRVLERMEEFVGLGASAGPALVARVADGTIDLDDFEADAAEETSVSTVEAVPATVPPRRAEVVSTPVKTATAAVPTIAPRDEAATVTTAKTPAARRASEVVTARPDSPRTGPSTKPVNGASRTGAVPRTGAPRPYANPHQPDDPGPDIDAMANGDPIAAATYHEKTQKR
jgi:HemY protein